MAKSIHVVPDKAGGWNIKQGGGPTLGHTATKRDAIDTARPISRVTGSELVIHDKDGKISSKDSHGRDPYPPKG